MVSDGDGVFDKPSLDELIELLVKRTTEYLELMEQKDANPIKLRDLKLELDSLHSMINQRTVVD